MEKECPLLEFLKAMQKGVETQIGSLASKMDANLERIKVLAKIGAHQEKMEATVNSIRSEPDEKIQRRIESVVESVDHKMQKTTEKTETNKRELQAQLEVSEEKQYNENENEETQSLEVYEEKQDKEEETEEVHSFEVPEENEEKDKNKNRKTLSLQVSEVKEKQPSATEGWTFGKRQWAKREGITGIKYRDSKKQLLQLLPLYQGPTSDELSSIEVDWRREMVAWKL
jgi:hypothetical protein